MIQVPHTPDAEKSLLGSILLDPACIDQIATMVRPDDFYDPYRQAVYETCLDTWRNEGELDTTILAENLRLSPAGVKVQEIMEIAESTPSSANAPYYAKIVADGGRRRGVIHAAQDIVRLILDAPDTRLGLDHTDDLCIRAIEIIAGAAGARGTISDKHIREMLDLVIEDAREGNRRMYTTGIEEFDALFGGIPVEGVVGIYGVNSSGKSTFCYNLLRRLAVVHGVKSRVFSFEVGARAATASILSAEARQPVHSILQGGSPATRSQTEGMLRGADTLRKTDIAFVEEDIDISTIYQRCARYRAEGVQCVMIDYIQNLPAPMDMLKAGDPARMAYAAKQCQRIGRSLGMLVLMVCQMTLDSKRKQDPRKEGDTPMPHHDDIIGSSSVSDVIDFGIGVWREFIWVPYQQPDESQQDFEERKHAAVLNVSKNKFGATGVANARYTGKYLRFDTKDPTWEQKSFNQFNDADFEGTPF